MKVYNTLPTLLSCLERWKTRPTQAQFNSEYVDALRPIMGDWFEDFYGALLDLDWATYRAHALSLDPTFEDQRFKHNLELVENCFGFKLGGETYLLGTFQTMDGFARFNRGEHKVYLGLDESHLNGRYLDVLTTHELTHVARESRPTVWEAFGLDPKMKRADFLEYQPVIEHVFGEGYSCAISELLIPGEPVWNYTYQSAESLEAVYAGASELDRIIHQEIQNPNGDYGGLYGIQPLFSQYVWGWQWVKELARDHTGGDLAKLIHTSSKDFWADALRFKLSRS